MAEYIERSAAIEAAKHAWAKGLEPSQYIEILPAANVAPVVHGRWEFLGPNRIIKECMCGTCSVCKVRSKYIMNTMLCPNCGAKMDGGESNATD